MLDVAKRASVSISTVSYVLTGTRPISEETRQRVLTAIAELGYQPNPLARGLASKRSHILAIVFPAIDCVLGITELEFLTSAARAASEHGYHLIYWFADRNDLGWLHQATGQGLVDGIILMEIHLDDARVAWLQESGFPFSMIGRCNDDGDGYVDTDFKQTLEAALAHLAGLGHTRIAYLNQSEASFEAGYGPAVRSKAAFEESLRSSGLNGVTRFCDRSAQAGYECAKTLFQEYPGLTALVTMNELAIPGMIRAITERGWKIPDDISLVVVVASVRVAELMVPKLTALESPGPKLGRLATEMLIEQLEGKGKAQRRILLPCCLVVGDSTGPNRRLM